MYLMRHKIISYCKFRPYWSKLRNNSTYITKPTTSRDMEIKATTLPGQNGTKQLLSQ